MPTTPKPVATTAKPPATTVVARSYDNWNFIPPKGVRIIHLNGYGHVRFHIEKGMGAERELIVALQEFVIENSSKLSTEREERHAVIDADEPLQGHLLPKESA